MEQKQPTLSPPTNRFIFLIREMIGGGEFTEDFRGMLEERKAGLEAAVTDLEKKKEQSDEKFLEGFKIQIQDLETAYSNYDEVLQLLSGYLEDPDVETLKTGEEKLIRATWDLTWALQRFDEKYLLSGPSRFNFVNAMIHMAELLKAGALKSDDLPGFVKRTRDFFEKAIQELDTLKEDPGEEGRKKMEEAYRTFIEGAEIYARFADSGNPDDLDKGIGLFVQAYEMLDKGKGDYQSAKYLERPTPSPYINLLLNTFDGIKGGKYPDSILEDNLDLVKKNYNEMKRQVDKVRSLPIASNVISEELPALLKAFENIESGIQEVEGYLADGDTERLNLAEKSLVVAANELWRLESIFKQVEKTEGKMVCMKCQHPNPVQSRICENCGATLPRFDEDYETYTMQVSETSETQVVNEVPLTENIARIFGAAEQFAKGEISHEDFESVLAWMEGIVEEGRGEIASAPSVEIEGTQEEIEELDDDEMEFCEAVKEATENMKNMVEAGLDELSHGINLLRKFALDGNNENFEQGKAHIAEGAKQLYVAQVFEPISVEEVIEEEGAGEAYQPADELNE